MGGVLKLLEVVVVKWCKDRAITLEKQSHHFLYETRPTCNNICGFINNLHVQISNFRHQGVMYRKRYWPQHSHSIIHPAYLHKNFNQTVQLAMVLSALFGMICTLDILGIFYHRFTGTLHENSWASVLHYEMAFGFYQSAMIAVIFSLMCWSGRGGEIMQPPPSGSFYAISTSILSLINISFTS